MELESFGVNLKDGTTIMVNERRIDFEEIFHGVYRLVEGYYLGDYLPDKTGQYDAGRSTGFSTSSSPSMSVANSSSLLFVSRVTRHG